MTERCPDFFPEDWETPEEKTTSYGAEQKTYEDGVISIAVKDVLQEGHLIKQGYTETQFPDGSAHFEEDPDTGLPVYIRDYSE